MSLKYRWDWLIDWLIEILMIKSIHLITVFTRRAFTFFGKYLFYICIPNTLYTMVPIYSWHMTFVISLPYLAFVTSLKHYFRKKPEKVTRTPGGDALFDYNTMCWARPQVMLISSAILLGKHVNFRAQLIKFSNFFRRYPWQCSLLHDDFTSSDSRIWVNQTKPDQALSIRQCS